MHAVAIIPARGGSKGIPRKNLQTISGVPLVGLAINAARAATTIHAVYVSTEDAEIAAVSREYGAEVIDRPAELAADEVLTAPVIEHALDAIAEEPGVVVVLECTNPCQTPDLIDRAVRALVVHEADTAITVQRDTVYLWRKAPDGYGVPIYTHDQSRRQDAPEEYRLAGGPFASRCDYFARTGYFIGGRVSFVEVTTPYVDVDEPADLEYARFLLEPRP